jgi:chromosome segregation ATPase
MTKSRYLIARVALAFGISRRQRRMAEAASETHLLREAEQILGERIWENVEDVEELGIEYWNLRRLYSERERLRKELIESEEVLTAAHEQRASLLGEKSDEQDRLEETRLSLLTNLEDLARERDSVVTKAREVRRLYDGLKTKLEVLKEEQREDDDVVEKTHIRMVELRGKFDGLKGDRDRIAREIQLRDTELDNIDKKLDVERKKHREEASEAFQQIGDANRTISECKAELGLIETRMQQLFGEIGRHVSRNAAANAECRTASRSSRPMVDVMAQLRKSINLNHRLSGT